MDTNADKKYFPNNSKKKQIAQKSITNYLNQLKMHFDLTDNELFDILKKIVAKQKNIISSKKWWNFFK